MSRFSYWFLALGLTLWVAGCGWSSGSETIDPNPQGSQLDLGALPGIPQYDAEKVAAAAGSYVFVMEDQGRNSYASWEDEVLTLAEVGFAYSILSYNLAERNPQSIGVDGTLDGMWLAVSDYNTGSWQYLGQHYAPQVHDLLDGNYKSPTGWIHFALVCPKGSSAFVTTTLGIHITEFDPPVWQEGEVGIKSLDTSYYDVVLEWYPAIDAESPPVTYLIYYGENETGIDWDNPRLTVPAQFTSTSFGIDENDVLRDYGVRAMDAQGNITTNTNFLSGSIPWEYTLPIFDWVPGDKLVMEWDVADLEDYFYLIGPYYLEGKQEDPLELDGFVEFSDLPTTSGLQEVWATLLEPAPPGGYKVEAHIGHWFVDSCVTYSFSILDSTGSLKTHLMNYTLEPKVIAGSDMFYLRNDPLTWPQADTWETGDRLEITWDDPAVDVNLWVQAPYYESGSPTYPEDLAEMIDFSQDSKDSGLAVEWAQLADGANPGSHLLYIRRDGEADTFDVTWTLYDSEGGVRLGPGTARISSDWGDVDHMMWLKKEIVE